MKKVFISLAAFILLGTACGTVSPPRITGAAYTNPVIGFSMQYPAGWAYWEHTDFLSPFYQVMLVSDPEVSGPPVTSGAVMGILNNYQLSVPLPEETGSSDQVLAYIMGEQFPDFSEWEAPSAYVIDSLPAASGIYTKQYTGLPAQVGYFTVILRGEEVLLFIGFCPQREWKQRHLEFDFILNSLQISYSPETK